MSFVTLRARIFRGDRRFIVLSDAVSTITEIPQL
jgi:hypothetical protein